MPLYAARRKSIRKRFMAPSAGSMGGPGCHAWHLLFPALRALGSRAECTDPGGSDRFSNSRFYFFFIEIWPQEVYYFTGLLVLAAMALFLMNAVAGRVWCGYLCPQTVWTDLFLRDRTSGRRRPPRAHLVPRRGPWTAERVARLSLKHFLWLMVAWWTGGAWVLYFSDSPTLVKELATFQAPFVAYVWTAS